MKKRLLYCICCVVTVMMLTACSGVNSLIKDIAALENVTLDSEEAIISASQKYEALDEADKEKITNIDILENAKMKYAVLEIQEKMKVACASEEVTFSELDEIMQVYAGFSDAQKETLNTELYADFDNRYKAAEIDNIMETGSIAVSALNFEKFKELMTKYNDFDDVTKSYVKNFELLNEAYEDAKEQFVGVTVYDIVNHTDVKSAEWTYFVNQDLLSLSDKEKCLKAIARTKVCNAAEEKVKSRLKSPKSYECISISVGPMINTGSVFTWVDITYSAMNGFGGYARDNATVYFDLTIDPNAVTNHVTIDKVTMF